MDCDLLFPSSAAPIEVGWRCHQKNIAKPHLMERTGWCWSTTDYSIDQHRAATSPRLRRGVCIVPRTALLSSLAIELPIHGSCTSHVGINLHHLFHSDATHGFHDGGANRPFAASDARLVHDVFIDPDAKHDDVLFHRYRQAGKGSCCGTAAG